jgi:predicted aspartyl protease
MGALALSLAGGMCARAEVGTDGAVAAIALHDGLVWAEVDCGGKKLHFVVDTGAESSCVDLAAARRLDMRLGGAVDVAGVGGRTVGYECSGFQASVGGMRLPEEVVALDLSGPSRACRQEIDGLIGADFFRGKVVRIDYARGVLSREPAPGVARGTPLRFEGGVICVRVAVNGGEARWTRLDTGCTEALEWCAGADCRRNGSRESVALASLAARAIPAEVTVGTARLEDVPVKVRKRQIFPGEAGLLGNGVLSRYRVTIDGIEKRLVLE